MVFMLWAGGAIFYDLAPRATWLIAVFVLTELTILWRVRGGLAKAAAFVAPSFLLLGWWLTLKPHHERDWQPDVAETAWAEIKGDEVTLHNVRNCDYRSETDFTPRWETRTLRLSQLTGIDFAICYWGSPYMAHPIASFQFADAPPVCFSIETRKEKGESYSAIGGFYRQFELIYIVADESDVLRVRTNFRKGEDVFLYRLNVTPGQARDRFMDYITVLNKLHDQPRWYNAATTNCTTAIRSQRDAAKRAPWDWRILVNGKGDEMMFERGAFVTDGLPFPELRQKARINDAARAADRDPDFCRRIRMSHPGFAGVAMPGSQP
ncbi:MAG: DUF4105 domain-containing protein [Verrucomicrobiaceae bacterium]|nr:DUF4105 domain-containing protein [Verrucomicrobiaceae bacterium]